MAVPAHRAKEIRDEYGESVEAVEGCGNHAAALWRCRHRHLESSLVPIPQHTPSIAGAGERTSGPDGPAWSHRLQRVPRARTTTPDDGRVTRPYRNRCHRRLSDRP